jgi:hypothetical protein
LIAILIVVFGYILLTEPIRNLFWELIKLLIPSCIKGKNKKMTGKPEDVTSHQTPSTSHAANQPTASTSRATNQQIASTSHAANQQTASTSHAANQQTASTSNLDNQQTQSSLNTDGLQINNIIVAGAQQISSPSNSNDQETSTENESDERIRLCIVGILSLVLVGILIGNPIVRYHLILSTNHTNLSTLDSVTNDNIYMNNQYGRNTIFKINNIVFFIVSIVVSLILMICNKEPQSDGEHHSSISSFLMQLYFALKEFCFRDHRTHRAHQTILYN